MMDLEVAIREYASTDFSRVKELILKAENFGESFLETELLNIKKNTSLGLGKVFVATLKDEVIGYISLGRRIFALQGLSWTTPSGSISPAVLSHVATWNTTSASAQSSCTSTWI